MPNTYLRLPMPTLNGAGASVDASGLGVFKTLIVSGRLAHTTVTIEASADGGASWGPVETFTTNETTATATVAATHLRTFVGGRKAGDGFTGQASVGGDPAAVVGFELPMPVTIDGNGAGAAIDCGVLGAQKTFVIAGVFSGATVRIETSTDGGTLWAPVLQTANNGMLKSLASVGQLYRVFVIGRKLIVPFAAAAAVAAPLADDSFVVSPGVDRAAAIQEAIDLANAAWQADGRVRTVQLAPGQTFTLEAPLVHESGVDLLGPAILIPTYTGAADDVANHVIGIEGEVDLARLSTTLTAIAAKNSRTITVAAIGNLQPGDTILVQGYNPPFPDGDAQLESDGLDVVLTEVLQVSEDWDGVSLTLPLVWNTQQHHGNTIGFISVFALTPKVSCAVRDVTIEGSQGGVTTAVGVFAQYAREIVVEDASVSGMSRSAVNAVGCGRVRVPGFFSEGTNNNWFLMESVVDLTIKDFDGAVGVDRVHPLGVPRNTIYFRERCTGAHLSDGFVTHVALGILIAGGEHLQIRNILCRDVEVDDSVYARWVAGGEQQFGGHVTLGLGFGPGPLNIAEFAFGVQISDIHVQDLRAPSTVDWLNTRRALAFYWHDGLQLQATNIFCDNRGSSNATVAANVFSDVGIQMTNLFVAGYSYGVATENVALNVQLTNYVFVGNAGTAPNAQIPLFLDHAQASSLLRIKNAIWSNSFSTVRFGGSFIFDSGMVLEDVTTDEGAWSRLVLGDNQSGVDFFVGDTIERDPTYAGVETRLRTPVVAGNYDRRLGIVACADVHQGFMLYAPLAMQSRATVTIEAGTAVAQGDSLEYVAPRRMRTNNAAVVSLGTALSVKTTVVAEQNIFLGASTG